MCSKCEAYEKQMLKVVADHTECRDEACTVPRATENYRETAFWLLGMAYNRCAVLLERIEKARELFDAPGDVPESVVREWEEHALRAAEGFARARMVATRREEERAGDRRVQ